MRATLATLYAYLSWVPLAYVFESNLVEALLKLFPQPPYRNVALQCLSEVRLPPPIPPFGGCPALTIVGPFVCLLLVYGTATHSCVMCHSV